MVARTVFPTASLASQRRSRKASLLSLLLKAGDKDAAYRFAQRRRGFLSLSVGTPLLDRIAMANAARARNQEARRLEKERAAAAELLQRELDQTR